MADPRARRLAHLLVNYSRNVKRGHTVQIAGPSAAEPLLLELGREVLRRGGHPMYRMRPERAGEVFYDEAKPAQLKYLPKSSMAAVEEADHVVNVIAETNTQALAGVAPKKQTTVQKARRPLQDAILSKNEWTLALYPTAAYAQDAGMSLEAFETFVYAACRVDAEDPVAEWKKAKAFQEKIIRRLRGADEIHIVAPETDLTLSVKGRRWMNSAGSHNMPDGEVFTGPVETSAEGEIRYTYPVCTRGKEVVDVRLEFEGGRVVRASAEKNEGFLKAMLRTDEGASRLGELGIGTNDRLQRFVKNILFDEKIGGSIHLAVGRSYTETGGKNESAIHWDMICDLRHGGYLEADGKVVQADGRFRL